MSAASLLEYPEAVGSADLSEPFTLSGQQRKSAGWDWTTGQIVAPDGQKFWGYIGTNGIRTVGTASAWNGKRYITVVITDTGATKEDGSPSTTRLTSLKTRCPYDYSGHSVSGPEIYIHAIKGGLLDPTDTEKLRTAALKSTDLLPPDAVRTEYTTQYKVMDSGEPLTKDERRMLITALYREQHIRNEWVRRALAADDPVEAAESLAALKLVTSLEAKYGIPQDDWKANEKYLLEAEVIDGTLERPVEEPPCPAPRVHTKKWRRTAGRRKNLISSAKKSNSRDEKPKQPHIVMVSLAGSSKPSWILRRRMRGTSLTTGSTLDWKKQLGN